MATLSPAPYADVEMMGAPQWLATKMIGPYIGAYLIELPLAILFLHRFALYWQIGDFSTLPRRRASKHVLIALVVLVSIYSCLVWEEAFTLAIRQKRTVANIIEASYAWNLLPLIASWTAGLVEASLTLRAANFITSKPLRYLFFAWQSLLIVTVITFGTLTCGLGFIFCIKGGEYVLPFDWNRAVSIFLSAQAAADVSISIALGFSLKQRILGFSSQTDGLLKALIVVAVKTALYTTVVSVIGAVVAGIYGDGDYDTTDLNILFWLPLPPLYALSFISTLSSSHRAIATTIGTATLANHNAYNHRLSGVNHLAPPMRAVVDGDLELGLPGGRATPRGRGSRPVSRLIDEEGGGKEGKRRSRFFSPNGALLVRTPSKSSLRSSRTGKSSPRAPSRSRFRPDMLQSIRVEVTTQIQVEAEDDDGEVDLEGREGSLRRGEGEETVRRYPPRSSTRFLHPGGAEVKREEVWETVDGEEKGLGG